MCGEKPVPPRVSEIHVQPSKRIDAEGTASLTVEASGKELQFKWSAARGRVSSPSAPSVVYTAPSAAGQDTVTVEVTGAGGTTVQSATFEVVPAAAPAEQNPTAQAVSITSHHKDQTVSCEEPVQGRYAPSVTGPIWPVVYVGGRYHPQDEGGQPATMSDGEWYGTVRFGDCSNPAGDEGRTFQLFVVTVDETANAAILKYFERTRKTGKYPGLIRLPKGTREYPPRLLVRRS
jgi:hypothetical protein